MKCEYEVENYSIQLLILSTMIKKFIFLCCDGILYNYFYAFHQSNPTNFILFSSVYTIAKINCFFTVVASLPAKTISAPEIF